MLSCRENGPGPREVNPHNGGLRSRATAPNNAAMTHLTPVPRRARLLCALLPVLAPLALCAAEIPTPPAAPPTPAVPGWPADKPQAPAALPGRGLAQHDFFYAGEAKTRDMYLVRRGAIVWSYHETTGKGEISDAVQLSNGNILFAHQYGATLITPDQKVLWHVDAPPQCEIHTAQPIGTERVLFIQNGPTPKLFVVNIATGATEREFALPVGNAAKTHGQFRHARLTPAGTVLVAHMDLAKVCEYDSTGKEVWSVATGTSPWSATRLANGNTLICGSKFTREVNPAGATVWEFTGADVPDYRFASMQLATRLPNGNTLINNWVNQWSEKIDPLTAPVQALEVTPEKKIVWALRSWLEPAALGPSTTIQLLDAPEVPEAVHFGEFK